MVNNFLIKTIRLFLLIKKLLELLFISLNRCLVFAEKFCPAFRETILYRLKCWGNYLPFTDLQFILKWKFLVQFRKVEELFACKYVRRTAIMHAIL